MEYNIKAVVLAAGKGTRLRTDGCELPKVMRKANGKPLLTYVLRGLSFIPADDTVIVVGYMKEEVTSYYRGYRFAEQTEQLGTGHAVMAAENHLSGFDGAVLVCCGDMPLISAETYKALVDEHFKSGNDCTMLTGTSSVPLPYGRVIRDADGNFVKIQEEKDCSDDELRITELNSGVYVFDCKKLISALHKLGNKNAQGEYYLTDAPSFIAENSGKIGICKRELGFEIIGVNTVEQLQQVEDILKK